jgi:BirA family biotin operon repressor/biotin-[acetyl-CoA-carboxylase] ligase
VAAGSKWLSPLGNLYVTYVFAVPSKRAKEIAWYFPQVTAAAVVKSLEEYGVVEGVEMKFVNDVFMRGKKICGVIAKMETEAGSANHKIMIGVGVNLNTSEKDYEGLKTATSVLIETGIKIDITSFAHTLARNIQVCFRIL